MGLFPPCRSIEVPSPQTLRSHGSCLAMSPSLGLAGTSSCVSEVQTRASLRARGRRGCRRWENARSNLKVETL